MQTRIKLAVIMLLFVTAFSCQKEAEVSINQSKSTGELKSSNDPTYLLRISTNDWCTRKGSNCASTVVIVGTKIDNYIDMANDPFAISNYFSSANSSEWAPIFPYVAEDSNLLGLLQTGKITFEILQDPNSPGRTIVRMHNADDSVSIGFPFLAS